MIVSKTHAASKRYHVYDLNLNQRSFAGIYKVGEGAQLTIPKKAAKWVIPSEVLS